MKREKEIIKISIIGIITNIFLVIFKLIIGLLASSIAVILDAINNLTDTLSATITIIGTKLASKKPDKEHPFGHGRVEYITSVIISFIVLGAGIAALKESVAKIINPVEPHYNIISIIIITASIFTKLILGNYVKNKGKLLNSSSLVATGVDAFMDAILSTTTLIAAILNIIFGITIEGYLGFLISLIIIKSSIEILKDTLNEMIGIRADIEETRKLRKKINSYKEVEGTYDLILHTYGPNTIIASAHIQVKDDMKAKEIHKLTRKITMDIYKSEGIVLTLGIYASNNTGINKKIKQELTKIIKEYKEILQLHGFYVDEKEKLISFDLIIDFDSIDPIKIKDEIIEKLNKKYPKYKIEVILDKDISD